MFKLLDPSVRGAAAAALLSALVFAGGSPAAAAGTTASASESLAQAAPGPGQPAAAQPSAPSAPKATSDKRSSADRTEARIARLHDRLHITAEQMPQWNTVAQAMRDDAGAVRRLSAQRAQRMGAMTAVDDLRSYRDISQAHADGLNKLIPAFEALYAVMSDDQKKNADAVFGHARRHGRPKGT
jgi:protein CpxP